MDFSRAPIAQYFNEKRVPQTLTVIDCVEIIFNSCFESNLRSKLCNQSWVAWMNYCGHLHVNFSSLTSKFYFFNSRTLFILVFFSGLQLLAEWHVHGYYTPSSHQLQPRNGFAAKKLHDSSRCCKICCQTHWWHFGTQRNAGQVWYIFIFNRYFWVNFFRKKNQSKLIVFTKMKKSFLKKTFFFLFKTLKNIF